MKPVPSDYYVILEGAAWSTVFTQVNQCLETGKRLFYFRSPVMSSEDLVILKSLISMIQAKAGYLLVADFDLFCQSGADGWHVKSKQLMTLKKRPENMRWFAAACHNELELNQAEKLGCDFVVLAPVKTTVTHPDAAPLGWEQFAHWIRGRSLPVYALGGLVAADLACAKAHGACGIAGIRLFQVSSSASGGGVITGTL